MLKLIALNCIILGSMVYYRTQVENIFVPAHHWVASTLDPYLPEGMR